MRAVVFDSPDGPLLVRDIPTPDCPPDGVVVEVHATGVCRSDWHAWRGHDPVALPHVPGHEFAGVVATVGRDVAGWRVGDRVTAPFVCGCGVCTVCLGGDPQVCPDQTQPGFTGFGSFADQVVVHAADFNLVRLPASLSFVAGASLGCRFATAYRALTAHGRVGPGDQVSVFGAGGVGLSVVMLASALGASVVAVDISARALQLAQASGATAVLDSSGLSPTEVADRVVALNGGSHVSIDALGLPATAVASVRSLRRRGRHIQIGLLLGDQAAVALPMDRVIAWELEIHGSHGISAAEYPAMFTLIEEAGLDLESLVGRVVGLDEAGAALAAMNGPAAPGMTVIRVRD